MEKPKIQKAPLPSKVGAWTRKELLVLPHRKWDDTSARYDSLLIFSTGRKHESGWACMAIVGCVNQVPIELCTVCSDDIEWKMPTAETFGDGRFTMGQYRSDCVRKSGALHFWTRSGKWRVGIAISSTEVELIPANDKHTDPNQRTAAKRCNKFNL